MHVDRFAGRAGASSSMATSQEAGVMTETDPFWVGQETADRIRVAVSADGLTIEDARLLAERLSMAITELDFVDGAIEDGEVIARDGRIFVTCPDGLDRTAAADLLEQLCAAIEGKAQYDELELLDLDLDMKP